MRAMVFLGCGALHRRPDPHRRLLHAGRSAASGSQIECRFKPVILWTDALVFLLVAVVIAHAAGTSAGRSICGRHGGRWHAAATGCARWWS